LLLAQSTEAAGAESESHNHAQAHSQVQAHAKLSAKQAQMLKELANPDLKDARDLNNNQDLI
jgi:hypothetical protein